MMTMEEKNRRLIKILESAIGELYESAEDWYADQVLDLIGTDEDELAELGVRL